MPFVVGSLEAVLGLNSREFGRKLDVAKLRGDKFTKNISRNFGRISRDMTSLGRDLTTQVTLPLAALAVVSTKAAIDFESSFAGVRKTVDATEEQFASLRKEIRALAAGESAIPIDVNQLNRIAELGGQLGIQRENLVGFTKTIANIGVTTDLTIEAAATQFAQFSNIMRTPQARLENMASSVVELGNNFATTESTIVSFALRLAPSAKVIGVTEAQVLGLSTALASVGINVEAGGTAISKTMVAIANAVATGGEQLDEFATVAGMTATDFRDRFRRDAAGALVEFIKGLQRVQTTGGNVFAVLDRIGLAQDRTRRALLSSASASDLLERAIETSTTAWKENNALTEEAAKRYETVASQLQLAKNRAIEAAIDIGETLTPVLLRAANLASDLAREFGELPKPIRETAVSLGLVAAALGPTVLVGGAVATQLARLGPALITGGRHLRDFSFFARQSGISAGQMFAASKLMTAGAVGAAFAIGNKLVPALVNTAGELLGLGPLFDDLVSKINELINTASSLNQQELEILGDPEQFASRVRLVNRQLLVLRREGLITQEQFLKFSQQAVTTPEIPEQNRRDLLAVEARVAALLRERKKAEEEAKAAIEGRGEADRLAAEAAARRGRLEAEALTISRKALDEMTDAQEESNDAATEAIPFHEQLRSLLVDEAGALSHGNEGWQLRRAFLSGATQEQLANLRALIEQNAELRENAELQQKANAVLEGLLTLEEKYQRDLELLALLHERGKLNAMEHARAVKQLDEQYAELGEAVERFGFTVENVAQAAQGAMERFFFDPFRDGVNSMVEHFLDALRRMAAAAAASSVYNAIAGAISGAVTGRAVAAPSSASASTAGFGARPGFFQHGGFAPHGGVVHPGEFVLRASATRDIGLDNLRRMNRQGAAGIGGDGVVVSNTFHVDARGAAPGVGPEVERALAVAEERIVSRSVRAVADARMRGGRFREVFR